MKICILDGYSLNPGDLDWSPVERLGDVTLFDRTPADKIVERAADADIVLTNKVPFSADTLRQLPRLRFICVLATGYNIIDTEAAARQGVVVANIPAYSTMSVAQMAFAHILNITNHVASYAREVADGKWTNCPDFCFWDSALTELAGKTMGIVGLGNTGMATARIAVAMGMKVVALTSKSADTLPEGITCTARRCACLSRRGQPSLPTHAVDTSSHQCRIHRQDETIGYSDQHRTRSACRRAGSG